MKGFALVGLILVLLGLLSFIVPVPHSENHGVKVGDAKIGIVLVAGGVIALVAGSRKG
jgi:hypothetical protein